MRVLLDQCVDKLGALLEAAVSHAFDLGWQELSNGKLLLAAERAGFDLLLTVDKNRQYQQNFSARKIALMTIQSRWVDFEHLLPYLDAVNARLSQPLERGSVINIAPEVL